MKNMRLSDYLETISMWHVTDECLNDEVKVKIPTYIEVDSEEYSSIYTKIGAIFGANAKRLKVKDNMITNTMVLGEALRRAIRMKHDYLVLTFSIVDDVGMDVNITSADDVCKYPYVYINEAVTANSKPYIFDDKIYSLDHDKLDELGLRDGDYISVEFGNVNSYCGHTPHLDLYSAIVGGNTKKHTSATVRKKLEYSTKVTLRVSKDIFCGSTILTLPTVYTGNKDCITVKAEDILFVTKDPKTKLDLPKLKKKWSKNNVRRFYIEVKDPIIPRNEILRTLDNIGFVTVSMIKDYYLCDGMILIHNNIVSTYDRPEDTEVTPVISLNDLLNGGVFEEPNKTLNIEQTKSLKNLIGELPNNSTDKSKDGRSSEDTLVKVSNRIKIDPNLEFVEYMSPKSVDHNDITLMEADIMDMSHDAEYLAYIAECESEMKIKKETLNNREVIGNQNKNNGGTKMKDALKKMMGNLEFGEANSDEVRMTMTGALAFNDGEDNWLSFNPITKTLVNNLEMVMDMPGFKMPKLRDQLQIGELITINNGTDYGFIIDVKPTQLKVLKKNGSVSTIKEIGNIMGTQSFYTVVKSINDFAGQGQNGMAFNPMMLAYMKGDDEEGGKDSSEMMKLIAMQGLFMNNPATASNGAMQNPMAAMMSNPMMLASMMGRKGKKGKGSSMEDIMMMSMMTQFMQMGMMPQPGLVQGNAIVEESTENVDTNAEHVNSNASDDQDSSKGTLM